MQSASERCSVRSSFLSGSDPAAAAAAAATAAGPDRVVATSAAELPHRTSRTMEACRARSAAEPTWPVRNSERSTNGSGSMSDPPICRPDARATYLSAGACAAGGRALRPPPSAASASATASGRTEVGAAGGAPGRQTSSMTSVPSGSSLPRTAMTAPVANGKAAAARPAPDSEMRPDSSSRQKVSPSPVPYRPPGASAGLSARMSRVTSFMMSGLPPRSANSVPTTPTATPTSASSVFTKGRSSPHVARARASVVGASAFSREKYRLANCWVCCEPPTRKASDLSSCRAVARAVRLRATIHEMYAAPARRDTGQNGCHAPHLCARGLGRLRPLPARGTPARPTSTSGGGGSRAF
eukprot:scaffold158_cov126-Isochrysis_galbana.AAC.9